MSARRVAFDVLMRVTHGGAYSHIALSNALDGARLSAQDAGLATELVYGTLTWQRAIDNLLNKQVRGGTARLDDPAHELLRLGVYQLVFLDRIPDHAATHEMVEIAKSVASPGAVSLVNAVLRKFGGGGEHVWWRDHDRERKSARYVGDRWSLPTWLANRLVQQFGLERAELMADAYTKRPPLWARRTGGDETVRLDGMTDEARTALGSGELVIQDLGSQVVGRLAPGGESALDGCAGLGGKSLHLAEHYARVVALDPLSSKLAMLKEAATRSGKTGIEAHESTLQEYETEEQFDLVLVDAPCTGLGTIRRHPESRWTRTESDIGALATIQAELLQHAAARVKTGGHLLYSVCTFTREETSRQVERFLEAHAEFSAVPVPEALAAYRDGDHYVRTSPDQHDCDGFFAALLVKSRGDAS